MDDGLTPVLVKRDGPRGWRRINKKDFDPAKHQIYTPPLSAPPPLPPLPPVKSDDPLDNLPADWREGDPVELKRFAFTLTGRTVDNGEQAVQVIEQAIAEKAAK